MANSGHRLFDIDVYQPNAALGQIMAGPGMRLFLGMLGQEAVLKYRARVAKKTGRLMASAEASTVIGGHKHDRWVGKVTIGGSMAVSSWKGKPFYYGVLHEHGSPRNPERFPAAKDLVDVIRSMKGGK